MKIKIIPVLLLMYISIPSFSNSNAEKNEFVELSILGYGDPSMDEGKQFVVNIENFIADNPEIKVNWDLAGEKDYNKKLLAAFDSGKGPDIVFTWNGGSKHRAVLDAGEAIDQLQFIDQDLYEKSAIKGSGENGELYAVPNSKKAHVVIYSNNELIESLGLKPATTYEELKAQLEVVTAERKVLISFPGALGWPRDILLYSPVLGRFGGSGFVNDLIDGNAGFSNEESILSFEFIKKIYDDGVFTEDTLNLDYNESLKLFNRGRALYLIDGAWRADSITLKDYSWNRLFSVPGEIYSKSSNGSYSGGYAIMKSAAEDEEKRESAVKLLKYMTGVDSSRIRANYSGEVPAIKVEENIIYREGSESEVKYIESLGEITPTLGDFLKPSVTSLFSDGIRDLWLGETTSVELALKLDTLSGFITSEDSSETESESKE